MVSPLARLVLASLAQPLAAPCAEQPLSTVAGALPRRPVVTDCVTSLACDESPGLRTRCASVLWPMGTACLGLAWMTWRLWVSRQSLVRLLATRTEAL